MIIGFIYDIDKGKTRNFGNYYPNSLLKYPELGNASILEPLILSLERTHKTCGFLMTIFGFSMSYIYLKIIWWNLEGKYCSLIILIVHKFLCCMGIYDSVLNVLTCISLTLNLHACMIKRSLETELAWAISHCSSWNQGSLCSLVSFQSFIWCPMMYVSQANSLTDRIIIICRQIISPILMHLIELAEGSCGYYSMCFMS